MGSPAPPTFHRHRTKRRSDDKEYARRRPEESVLYGIVQSELETFLARAQARERPVPRFVERELRSFLRCGILAHGFVRVHCDDCGLDRVVAFSCKGRGFCPSCGGRRMADTAAHLVDRVLPKVPVRQWVLSLPFALRYRLDRRGLIGPSKTACSAYPLHSATSGLATSPRRSREPAETVI